MQLESTAQRTDYMTTNATFQPMTHDGLLRLLTVGATAAIRLRMPIEAGLLKEEQRGQRTLT